MTGYEPGIKARRAILRELDRRETAGLPSPSLILLGELLELRPSTVREHVNILIKAGMIARSGHRLALTDCGRGVVNILM